MSTPIIIIITAIAVALLNKLSSVFFPPKSNIDEKYIKIINYLQKRVDLLQTNFDSAKLSIEELKIQVIEKNSRLQLLENLEYDLPIPYWMKDSSGALVSTNSAYEEYFLKALGINMTNYIGCKNIDIWPPEVAKRMDEIDKQVLLSSSDKTLHFIFPFEENGLPSDKLFLISVWKRYAGNIKMGIAGTCIFLSKDILTDLNTRNTLYSSAKD